MTSQEPDPGRSWRLGLLIAFGLFTGLLGVLLRNPQLTALGEAIAVALCVSYLLGRVSAASIVYERRSPRQACEEDWISVEIVVHNRGRLPAWRIEVKDRFAADALFERVDLVWRLGAGSSQRLVFERPCARGRGVFPLGPLEVTVSDPLGVFRFSRTIHLPGAQVVVWPVALPLESMGLARFFAQALAGEGERPRPGAGVQPLGLREHRAGQPLQRIHWRASARLGRLVLTERESPALARLIVALDLERGRLRGVGRRSNVELSIRLAASVLETAAGAGHACGLVADGKSAWALPALAGATQRAAFLDALAHLLPQGETPITTLLARSATLAEPGTCLVLVLPHWFVEAGPLVDALAAWRARGASIVVFVVDDRALMAHEWVAPVAPDEAIEVLAQLGIPAHPVGEALGLAEEEDERVRGLVAGTKGEAA
ncbi:MAG: DUF58 domain-containing protein [Planctomycetes bacterium]|nr:DUF58 domain-containing protein [Planctomycetota bacterium]